MRDSIADDAARECIIYDGTTEFEKVTFAKGGDEVAALIAALEDSGNFAAVKVGSASGALDTVTQKAFTAGTDPTATIAEYSAGFGVTEQYAQNCIIFDSSDYAVIALANAYVQRMFNSGKNVIGVCGETKDIDVATRMNHAAACNASNMVYVLNGNVEHGIYGTIDGYQTAAKIAGMISGTSCKYSLTHTVLSSITELREKLTNSTVTKAEES